MNDIASGAGEGAAERATPVAGPRRALSSLRFPSVPCPGCGGGGVVARGPLLVVVVVDSSGLSCDTFFQKQPCYCFSSCSSSCSCLSALAPRALERSRIWPLCILHALLQSLPPPPSPPPPWLGLAWLPTSSDTIHYSLFCRAAFPQVLTPARAAASSSSSYFFTSACSFSQLALLDRRRNCRRLFLPVRRARVAGVLISRLLPL
uniref:Uncharacterized protein n=1 Tax=Physcomitrium patens TaxID=3218 RepID=A0A7I4CP14_PHYPA